MGGVNQKLGECDIESPNAQVSTRVNVVNSVKVLANSITNKNALPFYGTRPSKKEVTKPHAFQKALTEEDSVLLKGTLVANSSSNEGT